MIQLANGSMNGTYVIMKSSILGLYPKLVVWPKGNEQFLTEWFNNHSNSIASFVTFDTLDDANTWILNNKH